MQIASNSSRHANSSFRVEAGPCSAHSQSLQESEKSRSSSFRVYYGGSSGAIPFKWESAPGTPIHALSFSSSSAAALQQLTPPPSYHFSDATAWRKSKTKPNLLIYVLQKLKMSARHVSPLHSSSSCSVSSSSSSGGSLTSGKRGYFRVGRLCGAGSSYSRPTSPLYSGRDYYEHGVVRTPSFGVGSSDLTLHFDKKKKKGFGGCFGA